MLKTRPIKSDVEPEDGLRVSVMSRHTLADGTTPDHEITPDLFDEWWPELAPPATLIGAYYKRNLPWEEFAEAYNTFLRRARTAQQLERLIDLGQSGNVTVLCIEDEPSRCHRRLIAEHCQLIEPTLAISIV